MTQKISVFKIIVFYTHEHSFLFAFSYRRTHSDLYLFITINQIIINNIIIRNNNKRTSFSIFSDRRTHSGTDSCLYTTWRMPFTRTLTTSSPRRSSPFWRAPTPPALKKWAFKLKKKKKNLIFFFSIFFLSFWKNIKGEHLTELWLPALPEDPHPSEGRLPRPP